MNKFYNGFTAVNNFLKKAEMFVGSACLAVLFVVMIVNAALRYLFHTGLDFSDELNGFLFVWLGFLSAAYIMANKGHLCVTALVEILPKTVQFVLSIIMNLIMVVVIVLYMAPLGKLLNMLPISNVMRLPLRYVYIILPICFILMAIHIICNIIDDSVAYKLSAKRKEV